MGNFIYTRHKILIYPKNIEHFNKDTLTQNLLDPIKINLDNNVLTPIIADRIKPIQPPILKNFIIQLNDLPKIKKNIEILRNLLLSNEEYNNELLKIIIKQQSIINNNIKFYDEINKNLTRYKNTDNIRYKIKNKRNFIEDDYKRIVLKMRHKINTKNEKIKKILL